jgi:ADP-ribose pyrophosphatase YjhB (NUDIX family)
MVADFLADRPPAAFQAGAPGADADPHNRTYEEIGRAVGEGEALIVVAACAFVRRGDRVLLQRRGDNGRWALPAGAMELGERIDRTAVREAFEETGMEVEPMRLIGLYTAPRPAAPSQPHRRSQLVVAYFDCRPVGGAPRADGVESTEVDYFPLDDLPKDLSDRTHLFIADALADRREAIVR